MERTTDTNNNKLQHITNYVYINIIIFFIITISLLGTFFNKVVVLYMFFFNI